MFLYFAAFGCECHWNKSLQSNAGQQGFCDYFPQTSNVQFVQEACHLRVKLF